MDTIVINPLQILRRLSEDYQIEFPETIHDFRYSPTTRVFGLRFKEAKQTIGDPLDEECGIILIYDETTKELIGLEILDIEVYLRTFKT